MEAVPSSGLFLRYAYVENTLADLVGEEISLAVRVSDRNPADTPRLAVFFRRKIREVRFVSDNEAALRTGYRVINATFVLVKRHKAVYILITAPQGGTQKNTLAFAYDSPR